MMIFFWFLKGPLNDDYLFWHAICSMMMIFFWGLSPLNEDCHFDMKSAQSDDLIGIFGFFWDFLLISRGFCFSSGLSCFFLFFGFLLVFLVFLKSRKTTHGDSWRWGGYHVQGRWSFFDVFLSPLDDDDHFWHETLAPSASPHST